MRSYEQKKLDQAVEKLKQIVHNIYSVHTVRASRKGFIFVETEDRSVSDLRWLLKKLPDSCDGFSIHIRPVGRKSPPGNKSIKTLTKEAFAIAQERMSDQVKKTGVILERSIDNEFIVGFRDDTATIPRTTKIWVKDAKVLRVVTK